MTPSLVMRFLHGRPPVPAVGGASAERYTLTLSIIDLGLP